MATSDFTIKLKADTSEFDAALRRVQRTLDVPRRRTAMAGLEGGLRVNATLAAAWFVCDGHPNIGAFIGVAVAEVIIWWAKTRRPRFLRWWVG